MKKKKMYDYIIIFIQISLAFSLACKFLVEAPLKISYAEGQPSFIT